MSAAMPESTVTSILAWALPVVLLASLVEAVVLHWRAPGSYDWKAAGVSVADQVLRRFALLLPLSIATPIFKLAYEYRLFEIDLAAPLSIGLLFFGQELCYYAYHRASHRVRWFWCNHAVHHSPNQLNLSAALRIGWLGRFTGTPMFFAPLVWLGFPPRIVFATLSLNLLYQFWIHATWIPKLGWLEYVLNTPSAHRVHHASNLEYLDANYGGVLIVFDRLFGSYRAERDDLPCRYGLVEPETSYNPLVVEFRPWASLFKDLAAARSVRAFFGCLLMPPGWRAEGEQQTTEALRERAGVQPLRRRLAPVAGSPAGSGASMVRR